MLAIATIFESDSSFIAFTTFTRFLEGCADTMVMNPIFSTLMTEFPNEKQKYMGYA
jgi:hypothetical protein